MENTLEKKYTVYKNDLKHRQHIDPNKSIWSDDVKMQFYENKTNTINERMLECKNTNYLYLDFSYMDLKEFPNIKSHKDYKNIKKIKYLFINNNCLTTANFLDVFDCLEVLDISTNKIEYIQNIPNSLCELMCHNNNLKYLCNSLLLITLDCSYNKLKSLGDHPKLKTLMCEHNELTIINTFPSAKSIMCKNNNLKTIQYQPVLEFLNCENTLVSGKLNIPSLKELICNSTNITDISDLKILEHVEMLNCSLTNIPYIPTLQDILCNKNANLMLDEKLVLKNYIFEDHHIYYVF